MARFGAAALFPALLAEAFRGGPAWTPLAAWAFAVASDFLDGRLARRAGAARPGWGRADVLADVSFNAAALGAGAALGLVRPWLAAAVVALGARFLYRSVRGRAAGKDRHGHLAGVLFYAASGGVAGAALLPGLAPAVGLAGDAVLLYAAAVPLLSAASERAAPSALGLGARPAARRSA